MTVTPNLRTRQLAFPSPLPFPLTLFFIHRAPRPEPTHFPISPLSHFPVLFTIYYSPFAVRSRRFSPLDSCVAVPLSPSITRPARFHASVRCQSCRFPVSGHSHHCVLENSLQQQRNSRRLREHRALCSPSSPILRRPRP